MPPPGTSALLRRDGAERSPLRRETQRGAVKARVETTRAAEGTRRGAGRTVLRVRGDARLGLLAGVLAFPPRENALRARSTAWRCESAIDEGTSCEVEAGC